MASILSRPHCVNTWRWVPIQADLENSYIRPQSYWLPGWHHLVLDVDRISCVLFRWRHQPLYVGYQRWGILDPSCPWAAGYRKKHYIHITAYNDVIKWKHFPRYWPFVQGIHRSLVNSPHKSQWRGALVLYLIYAWMNGWVNNREADDLRRHRAHYDVIVIRYMGLLQYRISVRYLS